MRSIHAKQKPVRFTPESDQVEHWKNYCRSIALLWMISLAEENLPRRSQLAHQMGSFPATRLALLEEGVEKRLGSLVMSGEES